jgi:hypothetical protein
LTVHCVNYVRQTKIHSTEPLLPELTAFDVEIVIEKLKNYDLPGSGQIPAQLIKAEGETLHFAASILINPVWDRKELPQQ